MNRADVVKLLGLGLLAGCTTSNGSRPSLPKLAQSGITHEPLNLRRGVSFPQLRPDGTTVPKTSRHYVPEQRLTPARHASSIPICTAGGDCGGGGTGGGTGGTNPSSSAYSGNYAFYAWNSSNYAEAWDDVNDVLLQQHYFGQDASGNVTYAVYQNDGTSASTVISGTAPASGVVVSTADGSAWGSWDQDTMSWRSQNSRGDYIVGYVDSQGYSNMTMTSAVGGSSSVRSSRGWGGGLHCFMMRIQADLMITNLLLFAALVATECGGGPWCAALNFLVQSLIWEQINEIKNAYHAAC